MPREFTRAQRVAEVIHHALAQLIREEVPTATFGMLTVTQVKLSPSLDYAKVYITILNDDEDKIKAALDLLEESNKHLRHLLAQTVKLRITPQLRFYYDVSQSQARKLTALIDEAVASDKKLNHEGPSSE